LAYLDVSEGGLNLIKAELSHRRSNKIQNLETVFCQARDKVPGGLSATLPQPPPSSRIRLDANAIIDG
jgi:hypothetical protein